MSEQTLTLGAYEKQVLLELDRRLTLREAQVFNYTVGARILLAVIEDCYEKLHTVTGCVNNLVVVSLLLFRGYVPTPDAIALALEELKLEATGKP